MIAGSLVSLRSPASLSEPPAWGTVSLAVVDLASGDPVGDCGLRDMSAEHRRALVWLTVGEAYRGRGYGTDALRALCRWAFELVNLAKVEAEVVASDAAAVALCARLGFVREVVRRRAVWVSGEWHDEHLLGLFPEELR